MSSFPGGEKRQMEEYPGVLQSTLKKRGKQTKPLPFFGSSPSVAEATHLFEATRRCAPWRGRALWSPCPGWRRKGKRRIPRSPSAVLRFLFLGLWVPLLKQTTEKRVPSSNLSTGGPRYATCLKKMKRVWLSLGHRSELVVVLSCERSSQDWRGLSVPFGSPFESHLLTKRFPFGCPLNVTFSKRG